MVAATVATPVLERLRAGDAEGVVRGATRRAAYVDLGGFVVALTGPGVPLMPNGVAVLRCAVRDGPARVADGRIELAGEAVTWDAADPPAWEPALARVPPDAVAALRKRGAAIREALGSAPPALAGTRRGRDGLEHLGRALRDRAADAAAMAADRLTGLGGGLTPEGDDVLTATAAVVTAAGEAVGFREPERARWLAALLPADAAARTTALSATLLALAAEGRIVEPVHRLLDLSDGDGGGDGDGAWRPALETLAATGASTGRAYAAAVGATIGLLSGNG